MFIENKVKATYNWIIAVLFLFSCIIQKIAGSIQLSFFSICLIISFGLIVYGFYIYQIKRVLKLIEEAFILVGWFVLCSLLINQTNGIYSLFFPGLYFIVLIYASFIKERMYFIVSNILTAMVLLYWAFLSNNQLNWTYIKGYIICVISYIAIVIVIRCYRSICLLCDMNN